MSKQQQYLFILSDSTGDTASRMLRAALKQFVGDRLTIRRFPHVLRNSEVRSILREAGEAPTMVVHTFAGGPLREMMQEEAENAGIEALDLLGPLIASLKDFLDAKPKGEPGLLHRIDEDYFRRIDAVEFAVMHDDGKHLDGLRHADIVLVGVSRTGKTPLSVYLALEGWRVGNVPLIHRQPIPPEVLALPRDRVVGLFVEPRRLAEIRRSRLEYIAPGRAMDYDDEALVREELRWSRRLLAKQKIRVVDVTQKAVEETAHQVLSALGLDGKRPGDVGKAGRAGTGRKGRKTSRKTSRGKGDAGRSRKRA